MTSSISGNKDEHGHVHSSMIPAKKSSTPAGKGADNLQKLIQESSQKSILKLQAGNSEVGTVRKDVNQQIQILKEKEIQILKEGASPKDFLKIQDTIRSVKATCDTMQSLGHGVSFKKEINALNKIEKELSKASKKSAVPKKTTEKVEPSAEKTTASATTTKAATIDKVPTDGIKVGLPNIDNFGRFGNTCWLNTTLKFIACTDFYDEMMTNTPPEGMEKLQTLLKTIINELRTGKGGTLDTNLYKNFLIELQKKVPFTIGPQNDAPEFLLLLTQQFAWQPSLTELDPQEMEKRDKSELYPRQGQVYVSKKPGVIKYGHENYSHSQLNIDIPYYVWRSEHTRTTGKIDLAENDSDVVRDVNSNKTPPGEPIQQNFTLQTRYTFLPPTLMLNLKRGIKNDFGQSLKAENPIKLDDDGYITLTEYAPDKDKDGNIIDMKPAYTCRYRIGASMTHEGGPGGGHFVCEERAANGTLQRHSDTSITTPESQGFGTQGYFIRLDLVEKRKLAGT